MFMFAGMAGSAGNDGKEDEIVEKIAVTGKTTNIQLELQGNSSIVLVETENVFGIRNLKYSGTNANPVTVEQAGDTIKLTQKSGHKSWFRPDPTTVSYELLLPKNRKIDISADHAELTGSITASDLLINGGSLVIDGLTVAAARIVKITGGVAHIDMEIVKCNALKLSLGNVSGKITVPDTASVSNTAGVSTLSIYRSSAGGGTKAKKASWLQGIQRGTLLASDHPGKFHGCPGD
jgi:hypothetical protein